MKVRANAKVNLSLDITGKRTDGYHTLRSVMQSVGLYDELEVTAHETVSVMCDRSELSGDANLAARSARLFFEKASISGGALIKIKKNIPVAGGLGGGSADAAAVLVALNRLYGEPLDEDMLLSSALLLGADVPFCLTGGTRLAEGIGEKLTVLPSLPKCRIVIAKKGFKSSTGDMYRRIDSEKEKRVSDTDGIIAALEAADLHGVCKCLYNRFEEVSDRSVLFEAGNIMSGFDCLYCGLSGAGPSVIGIFESDASALEAAKKLDECGFKSKSCEPRMSGIEIIE